MKKKSIKKQEFNELISGVKESFSDEIQRTFLKSISFENLASENIDLKLLLNYSYSTRNIYESAILKRVVAVKLILDSRNSNDRLDLKETWKLIYESLINLEDNDIISSIGSQGFLSIPLFRLDKVEKSFDFLRLHIWDLSFENLIDREKVNNFSIHSHQFHANSWILTGEIQNIKVSVKEVSEKTDFNLFNIEWNNSKNNLNQKNSLAVNTNEFVEVSIIENKKYHFNDTYEIQAGDYHIAQTKTELPISSTLFLFSTLKSRVKKSNVVGPSEISTSEINRKLIVNPKPLLKKLNSILTNE